MLRTSRSVLSTILASAGDITTSAGYISITGCPTMKYALIDNAIPGYQVKVAEVLASITVTPTATTGVPSTLVITQYRGDLGKVVTEVVSYTPIAGDTATIICNQWRAQLKLFKDLYVAGSGTATFIIAASASSATTGYFGSAILTVASTSGTATVAQTQAAAAITGVTVATETLLVTGATTGAAAGGTIAVSGVVGATNVNGVFIIGTVASTTIGLKNFYTGLNIAQGAAWTSGGFWVLGTVPYVASTSIQTQGGQSRGAYWDLIAVGVDSSKITVGKTYNQITFIYRTMEGGSTLTVSECAHTLFVQDDATNFAAFATRMNELTNDFVASNTTADPLNASII